jgi:hypothetical protein
MLFFFGEYCRRGPPSLHYYCAVVLHSCIVLPPVGHSSNHEYHCCQLTRQSAVFRIFIALLNFSFDSPSYFATSCLLCPDVLQSIMFLSNINIPFTSRRQRHCRPTVMFRVVMSYPWVRVNVSMKLGESRTILATQD